MRRVLLRSLLAASVLLTSTGAVGDSPPPERGLRLGAHDIASLTAGHATFFGLRPLGVSYEKDPEHHPEESESPWYLHGSAEEIIEIVKWSVTPRYWEEVDGASISALGERKLIVRASPAIHAEIAKLLREMDTPSIPHSATIHVDLRTGRPTNAALLAWNADTSRAQPPSTLSNTVHASITVHAQDRCAIERGIHRSLVRGATIKRAGDSATKLPDIGIARYGFHADVKVSPIAGSGRDRVSIGAQIARAASASAERASEASLARSEVGARWRTEIVVPHNAWVLAGVDDGWALFVRTRRSHTAAKRAEPILWLDTKAADPMTDSPVADSPIAEHVAQRFSIADLNVWYQDITTDFSRLEAPGYEAPEPAELGTREAVLNPEYLVELIQSGIASSTWETGTITAQNGILFVRNEPRAHQGIAHLLQAMRRDVHQSVVTDVFVYDVPSDVPEISATPESMAQLAGLTPTHMARVRSNHGRVGASPSGLRWRYIDAYEAERTNTEPMGVPVVSELGLGLTVQIRANASPEQTEAVLEIRLLQQALLGTKSIDSPHGPIQLPEVDVLQANATMRVPMDQPTIAFRTEHNGKIRVVTVTPRVER